MEHFPFQIKIRSLPAGQIEIVECRTVLRTIAGKRDVYDALWQEKNVILKVFAAGFLNHLRLKKEWKNLQTLQKLKINSPNPLFYGRTDTGQWALVTENITGSSTALELFNNAANFAEKFKIFELVCKQIALQNSQGVLQKDLHLGNFLIRNNTTFALDPAQTIFLNRPLKKTESTSQLAFLASYIADNAESVKKLAGEYFNARNWQLEKPDEELLKKEITQLHKRYIRKSLKKTLRTGSKFQRVKAGHFIAVFDKSFIAGTSQIDFIKSLDSLMDAGQILKNGNTCYVSRINFNGKNIVVKRYNHKGLIHSLRITFKRSRARRCWLYGHLLSILNIPTPKPVAFIELLKGAILWQSYLVTEFVDGRRLYDCLLVVNNEQRSKIALQIRQLLDNLGKNRITHGDLKPTNILIIKNGPVLTDLDAMKVHRCNFLYQRMRTKDTERFTKLISSE